MKVLLSVSSAASEKAAKLGLKHVGFGRYADPKTRKITHASKGGKLVKLKDPQPMKRKIQPPKKTAADRRRIEKNIDKTKKEAAARKAKDRALTGLAPQRNKSFYRMTHDPQLGGMVPTGAKLEKHKDAIINDTAAKAHDQWAADYKQANGKDATRVKKTKDADWIKKNGTDEVDIANTKFDDLPSDWQKENLEGAKAAFNALHKVYAKNTSSQGYAQAADLDKAASAVHDSWLERNGAWAPEHQKQPFDKLSTEEQDKDRSFIDSALRSYAMRAEHTYVGGGNYTGDK